MSEQLSEFINRLRNTAAGTVAAGAVSIADKMLYENFAQYHKMLGPLRRFREGVLPIVYSLIGSFVRVPGAYESLSIGLFKEIDAAFEELVRKSPYCFARDASNIECFNLDAGAQVSVKVDGAAVTFASPPVTDSNGHVVIALPSPLAAGRHEIVVSGNKKAFYGAVVV